MSILALLQEISSPKLSLSLVSVYHFAVSTISISYVKQEWTSAIEADQEDMS